METTTKGGTTAGTLLLALSLLAGCGEGGAYDAAMTVPGGDPEAGHFLVRAHGCGACHRIDGVRGPDANVGPPLNALSSQVYIAGVLPNLPENMVRWLMDPPAIDPRTAMPDLGLSEREATDIAAFLYSLEGG
ncbi:c-type cytochrome [Arenibaculum sp.]|uniref:c-type cytochrome n=1 Tax=Arenibaculum sp. TaxID=2865862 RepID=UPI002E101834|nr:c-type cytochrome [Arenibaculum sp.]